MNRNSLVATINSVCNEKLVQAKMPDGTCLKYLHVFDRPHDGEQIGITEEGYWCVADEGKIWPLKSVDHSHFFFLLLYTPLKEIIISIKNGLKSLDLPEAIIITFPFDELILGAIQTGWKDQALKWTEEGFPLNEEMLLYLCNNDKQSKVWLKHQRERLSEIFNI